jgi:hypothetical protein
MENLNIKIPKNRAFSILFPNRSNGYIIDQEAFKQFISTNTKAEPVETTTTLVSFLFLIEILNY